MKKIKWDEWERDCKAFSFTEIRKDVFIICDIIVDKIYKGKIINISFGEDIRDDLTEIDDVNEINEQCLADYYGFSK